MSKDYNCSCWMDYPNELHKRACEWKCVERYEYVGKSPRGKTRCKLVKRRRKRNEQNSAELGWDIHNDQAPQKEQLQRKAEDLDFTIKVTKCTKEDMRKRCCCNCRRNIRSGDPIECHCEIDGHYIGYVECFEGWCRRWAKERSSE